MPIRGRFAAALAFAALACVAACSSFTSDDPSPGPDAGSDAAGGSSSFCAQFDGGVACADFDDSMLPYGASFARAEKGVTSSFDVVPADTSHPSPSLATAADPDPNASEGNDNEAIIHVDRVSIAASGMHVEADFRFGDADTAGTVLQIYGNMGGNLVFGAYTHFMAGDVEEHVFDNAYQPLGGGILIGALGAVWAHVDIDITPAGSSPTLTAVTTVDGKPGIPFTQTLPPGFTSITVGVGSFPDLTSTGTFSVRLDNVLVRPH